MKSHTIFLLALPLTPFSATAFAVPPDSASPFAHTRVIGYSQVGMPRAGWFVAGGVFESIVGDDRWELLWHGGAGVDRWRNPDFAGWSDALVSPCPGDTPVDRVVLSISGSYGDNEAAWVEAIEATIENIHRKLPSVRQIVLQPVVGGPGGQACPAPANRSARSDGRVRASWQHAHIVRAIATVVAKHAGDSVSVIAGCQPTVRTCEDYADSLGHLTPEGAEAVARQIAAHYVRPRPAASASGSR